MQIINKENVADVLWTASLGKETVGIYARTSAAATQKAVEHFKPSKKERQHIIVKLK